MLTHTMFWVLGGCLAVVVVRFWFGKLELGQGGSGDGRATEILSEQFRWARGVEDCLAFFVMVLSLPLLCLNRDEAQFGSRTRRLRPSQIRATDR